MKIIALYLLLLLPPAVRAQEGSSPAPVPTPQWRPLYHFTPEKNWTNDPNGLLWLDGVYHLYNQQNPYENKWGHMSWGHATSTDLVHWRHLPIALPESIGKDTTWRFSGCAVWDKDNTSGLCRKGGCIVTVYTADQPNLHKESQFIAYSNDGGMTLTDYSGNPVIDLHKRDFRDPNVFWHRPSGKWVMVVALPRDYTVRFYGSSDLKTWDLLSEFGPQGFVKAAWECPFLIQLPVKGEPGRQKWVLATSAGGPLRGPFMQYFVGDFDGREFRNDNPPDTVLTLDYGDCFYAAIPWNGLPDEQKTFIGWMVPGSAATSPWKGQMSVPRDLALQETGMGLRLVQEPAGVFGENLKKSSREDAFQINGLALDNKELTLGDGQTPGSRGVGGSGHVPRGNAYWLEATFRLKGARSVGLRLAGGGDPAGKMPAGAEIGYDESTHELYVNRVDVPKGWIRKDKLRQTMMLPAGTDSISLQVFLDKSSLEVFVNQGQYVLSTYIYPDERADRISVFASGGAALLPSLTIRDLSTIRQ